MGLILISLVISASSTIWFSNLFNNNGSLLVNVLLLFMSYFITAIPNVLCANQLEQAEYTASEQYNENFLKAHKNESGLILDKKFRENQEPWLISTSRNVIKNAQIVLYSSLNSTTAILIDAITMSVIINPRFMLGYAGGGVIYAVLTMLLKNKIAQYTVRELKADKDLSSVMMSGWGNIVSGNNHNFNLWHSSMKKRFNSLRNAAIQNSTYSKIAGSFITTIAIIPILGVTAWLFLNAESTAEKALLLAILPRQALTLGYLDSLSSSLVQLSGIRKNLSELETSVDPNFIINRSEPLFQIFWKNLKFFDTKGEELHFPTIQSLVQRMILGPKGRLTIRADNGAGKSVLMCHLKKSLEAQGIKVYLLPTGMNLAFSVQTDEMSVGTRKRAEMIEIIQSVQADVYMLDEWDANLDESNISALSRKLEELSKSCTVIEVRHRKDVAEDNKMGVFSEAPIIISFKSKTEVDDSRRGLDTVLDVKNSSLNQPLILT